MYHSLRLLTGKTAVFVAKLMTHYAPRTTHLDKELHNDTVKDIRALARGDAPAISGIARVVVNRLRRQREGERDSEQEHYKPGVNDAE